MSHSYQASELKKKISKKRKGRAALGLPSSFSARRQSCYSDTFSQRRRVYQRGTASSSCHPTRSRNIPPPLPKKKNKQQNQTSLQLTDQTTRLPRSTQTLQREQDPRHGRSARCEVAGGGGERGRLARYCDSGRRPCKEGGGGGRGGKGKDSGAGNRSLATHSPACASLPPAPSGARGSAVLPRARLRQGSGGGGGGGGLGPSCLNKSYLQEKSFGLRSSLLGAVQLPFPFPLGSRSGEEKLEGGPAVGGRAAAPPPFRPARPCGTPWLG